MEIVTNKNLTLKIVILLVFVILFNFCAPTVSRAEDGDVGGMLFEPVKDLLLTIGDSIINIVQSLIFGTETSLLKLEHKNDWLGDIGQGVLTGLAVVGSIATVVVGVVGAIPTGGMSLAAAGAIASTIIGGVASTVVIGGATYVISGWAIGEMLPPTFYLPMYAISPEQIFSNEIPLLDVNFFNPKSNDYYENIQSSIPGNTQANTDDEPQSSAAILQSTIANWYLALRNFCIVVLLSVLLYTGIRIIISSSSQDKAKYKQRLMDWVVGMCLLFFLHYIMSFAMTVTDMLVDSLSTMNPKLYTEVGTSEGKLKDYHYVYNGEDAGKIFDTREGSYAQVMREAGVITATEENPDVERFIWPTNLMGKARMEVQIGGDSSEENLLVNEFGYTLIFVALVIYTILFLFRYLRRLLMLAFLTIIAPFVAMTYPLDKMSDGNAQAFNLWFKEYIYNLLIQPVHLILYTVLIGSAIDLAKDNMLYAIVALGFILQAEKIVRKFFGFEKASTLAGGSALGGALAMQGINQLRKLGGGSKKQKGGGQSGEKDKNGKINYSRKPDSGKSPEELMEQTQGNNDGGARNPQNNNDENANPLDKTSAEGRRMQEGREMLDNLERDAQNDEDSKAVRQLREELEESDTRGIGQALYDRYQGSNLQASIHSGINAAKDWKPVRAVRNVAGKGANKVRMLANTVGTGANNLRKSIPKPLRNSAKTLGRTMKGVGKVGLEGAKYIAPKAARATLAGAAAVTGVAAGLVSDDYSNVFKYGAAGLGAGWIAGGGISSITGKIEGLGQGVGDAWENAASTYTIAAKGEEAEAERQKAVQDKKAMLDVERRKLYERKLKLSAKQAREAMKDAQKYRESGLTDDELIIKAMKAEGFGDDRASKERIILAGLAQEVGTSKKELDRMKKGLSSKGFTNEQIENYSNAIKKMNDWTY